MGSEAINRGAVAKIAVSWVRNSGAKIGGSETQIEAFEPQLLAPKPKILAPEPPLRAPKAKIMAPEPAILAPEFPILEALVVRSGAQGQKLRLWSDDWQLCGQD